MCKSHDDDIIRKLIVAITLNANFFQIFSTSTLPPPLPSQHPKFQLHRLHLLLRDRLPNMGDKEQPTLILPANLGEWFVLIFSCLVAAFATVAIVVFMMYLMDQIIGCVVVLTPPPFSGIA